MDEIASDELIVRVVRRDCSARVMLEGELDLATADHLRRVLSEVVDTEPTEVLVDLERLTFIGSTGINALVAAGRRLEEHGGRLVLSASSPATLRVIEICGLTQLLERGSGAGGPG